MNKHKKNCYKNYILKKQTNHINKKRLNQGISAHVNKWKIIIFHYFLIISINCIFQEIDNK